MPTFDLVQFYYSTKVKPSDKYPTDIEEALKAIERLKAKGYRAEAIDIETIADPFRIYHKACTGPSFKMRAVFGEVRGADYKEFFGRTIPALFFWADAKSRAPVEVYPRMDHELQRMIFVNEALDNLLADGTSDSKLEIKEEQAPSEDARMLEDH